jgi:hypothetical protein
VAEVDETAGETVEEAVAVAVSVAMIGELTRAASSRP